jgi:transposase
MSSSSGKTGRERIARCPPGDHTVVQPGRPLADVIVHPEQLNGPRARTRIRPGAAVTRSGPVEWISVGIDVSKSELVIAVPSVDQRWTSEMTSDALSVLVERLVALSPSIIVMEATAGYEVPVAVACAGAGLPVAVVNPRQIRAFAQAIGRIAKTDAIDAEVIAAFGQQVRPEPRPLPDAATHALAALVARRRQLLDMLQAERQRLEQATTNAVQRDLRNHIRWLERRVTDVDDEMNTRIQQSPVWRAKEDLLRSVPGIGPAVSRTLLAELPELGQLDRRACGARRRGPAES